MRDKGPGYVKAKHCTLGPSGWKLLSLILYLGHCVDQKVFSWTYHCNMQIGAYGMGIYRMLQMNDFCLSW